MSSVDYVIIAIIALSAVIGLWRGFVREALSLVIWVAAFWLAYLWAGTFETYFSGAISDRPLRLISAFVLIFLMVHVAGFVISRLSASLLESIGLSGVDRLAGGGFGIVRGVVLVAAVVLVAGMTSVAEDPRWQQSRTIALCSKGLAWVQHYYPLDIKAVFSQARN